MSVNGDRMHPTHRQGIHLLVCCGIGFLCFFGAYMRIPVLPLFAASLGATTPQVGMINAAFMLSAGLLAIPSGLLSDRFGQWPMLLAGLLTIACSSLLIPFCSGPLTMGCVYLLFGAGLAAFAPTMMSYVANITPASHLGRAYSFYTTAVYLGMTVGPAIGGFLGRAWGLGRVFWASGGTVFLALPFMLAFLSRADSHPFPDREHRSVWRAVAALLGNHRFVAALVGTLGGCFGFGMFVSFLPLHARAEGLNAGHVGMVFGMQALANVLLRIPLGRLSDRLNRGTMSAWGLALLGLSLGTVGIFNGLMPLAACAAVVGAGMGVSFTALGALVAEVVSREERGLGLGVYNSCIYLGMMLSSATMGGVIHRVGFGWGFAVAGGCTLLATVLFHVGFRRASRAHLDRLRDSLPG
ncbi:MFS transporter [Geobacter sp. AOG1]|uniref:MFS transporter n=1 Tax=Geobacter sp. AOG1 TaxID=1566346 RepID=UPI001CC47906|nr:MFS transporter [Geobacter sp. AOG1]GFE56859.1 MFS transporter [Geobacter sp. AOG1]